MVLLVLLVVLAATCALAQDPVSDKKIVAYYISWGIYARNYKVTDIPAEMISHINYAFAKIAGGRVVLADPWADTGIVFPNEPKDSPYHGNFNQLRLLKGAHPHLKTFISVGGWTLSSGFSTAAATEEGRKKFAASCVFFIQTYGFDGVDLDWEYPVGGGIATDASPDDTANYVLLLKELHAQLDATGQADGKRYLLTVATASGPDSVANLDLPGMNEYLDWFNVMTYDYHGSWENAANHATPLYGNPADSLAANASRNIDSTIALYLRAGVPASKIVLGVPFYGRGWDGVPEGAAHGLFGTGAPSSIGTREAACFDYDDLAAERRPSASLRFYFRLTPAASLPEAYGE